MRDRLLTAGLFGSATALFWAGYWVLTRDGAALPIGGVALVATLIVSVAGAPRLAADATDTSGSRQGWGAGALMTLAAFVLGAFLFAWLPLFTSDVLARASGFELVGGVLQLFCISLLVGLIFLAPALPIGMSVGRLLYRLHRRARR